MTLLDAPAFDEARDRLMRRVYWSAASLAFLLFVSWWLIAGMPVDWPWNWNHHLRGRMTVNAFFKAVEANDMAGAYAIWIHDSAWRQHPAQYNVYPFDQFEKDWSPAGRNNDYGAIQSHRIVEARMYGNVLLMAIYINGRKSKAVDLDYDPAQKTLNFSPEDVQLYLGP